MKGISFFWLLLLVSIKSYGQSFHYDSATARYSLIADDGRELIHQRYLEVRPFKNGKAWVKDTTGCYHAKENTKLGTDIYDARLYGTWGIINKKGKWVLKPSYQELDTFIDGRAAVGLNEYKYNWYRIKGDGFADDHEWFKGIEKDINYKYLREVDLYKKFGVVRADGKLIIPVQYDRVGLFMGGLLLAYNKISNIKTPSLVPLAERTLRSGFFLVNEKNEVVKKLDYTEVMPWFYIKDYSITNSYFDTTIHYDYRTAPQFYRVINEVESGKELFGILNSKGEVLIAPRYAFKTEKVINILVGDGYETIDSMITEYSQPEFIYDLGTDQYIMEYHDSTNHEEMIISGSGEILYRSSNNTYIKDYYRRFRVITFEKPTGKESGIVMEFPISEHYDTVRNWFARFEGRKDLDLRPPYTTPLELGNPDIYNPEPFLFFRKESGYFGLMDYQEKVLVSPYYRKFEVFESDELLYNRRLMAPPDIYYVPSISQYIIVGTNEIAGIFEVLFLDAKGNVLFVIPGCSGVRWVADKKIYELSMSNGSKETCTPAGVRMK